MKDEFVQRQNSNQFDMMANVDEKNLLPAMLNDKNDFESWKENFCKINGQQNLSSYLLN